MFAVLGGLHLEAQFFEDLEHGFVIGSAGGLEALYLLFPAGFDDAMKQFGADAGVLEFIGDDQAEASFIQHVDFAHAAGANDALFTGLGVFQFGNQGDLAIVVAVADAGKSFVRGALGELHGAQVALHDGAIGERFVEFDQHRLVFGTDRADGDCQGIIEGHVGGILDGVGANGQLGQFVFGDFGTIEHDAGVEGKQLVGGGQQRVDIQFLYPFLLGVNWLKRTMMPSSSLRSTDLRPRTPLSAL